MLSHVHILHVQTPRLATTTLKHCVITDLVRSPDARMLQLVTTTSSLVVATRLIIVSSLDVKMRQHVIMMVNLAVPTTPFVHTLPVRMMPHVTMTSARCVPITHCAPIRVAQIKLLVIMM